MRKQGFSEGFLRVLDTNYALHQGEGETYVRYYTPKRSLGNIGTRYTKFKLYFDPCQDDGQFGEHQIQFTNNWRDDELF